MRKHQKDVVIRNIVNPLLHLHVRVMKPRGLSVRRNIRNIVSHLRHHHVMKVLHTKVVIKNAENVINANLVNVLNVAIILNQV